MCTCVHTNIYGIERENIYHIYINGEDKSLLTAKSQIINVQGMTELECHHLAIIIGIIEKVQARMTSG